jgi:hypothetical protein
MRGGVGAIAVVFVALLVAASAAGASSKPRPAATSMTVTATPHAAGAHRIRLTLTLHYEMQCNYPGAGPVVVTFPKLVRLPHPLAAGSVRLAGKATAAKTDGHRLTVTVPPHKGMFCNLMAPGSLKLLFMPAAGIAGPAHAGTYRFEATHRGRAFAGRLTIKPAA